MTEILPPLKVKMTDEEKKQKRKEYMKSYMKTYMSNRRANDEDFKKDEDERLRKYYVEKYNNDAEWREKKRQSSKALYNKYKESYLKSLPPV